MSGLFCADFWDGGCEGGADAVGRIGRGVRRNWSQRQTKFGRKSHFLSTLEPARDGFGVGGRTFFQIFEILFYFRSRAGRIWSRR